MVGPSGNLRTSAAQASRLVGTDRWRKALGGTYRGRQVLVRMFAMGRRLCHAADRTPRDRRWRMTAPFVQLTNRAVSLSDAMRDLVTSVVRTQYANARVSIGEVASKAHCGLSHRSMGKAEQVRCLPARSMQRRALATATNAVTAPTNALANSIIARGVDLEKFCRSRTRNLHVRCERTFSMSRLIRGAKCADKNGTSEPEHGPSLPPHES